MNGLYRWWVYWPWCSPSGKSSQMWKPVKANACGGAMANIFQVAMMNGWHKPIFILQGRGASIASSAGVLGLSLGLRFGLVQVRASFGVRPSTFTTAVKIGEKITVGIVGNHCWEPYSFQSPKQTIIVYAGYDQCIIKSKFVPTRYVWYDASLQSEAQFHSAPGPDETNVTHCTDGLSQKHQYITGRLDRFNKKSCLQTSEQTSNQKQIILMRLEMSMSSTPCHCIIKRI